jgi:hypothetical protein
MACQTTETTAGSRARTMMSAFHWSLVVSALAIKRETQQRLVDGHHHLPARPLSLNPPRELLGVGSDGVVARVW